MRILHVINSLCPEAGGPPEIVRQLARAHIEVNASMEVVCLDDPSDPFLLAFPCPVHAIGQSFLGRYGLSTKLWSWLRSNSQRFDGIVMHGIWTFPSVALRFVTRSQGIPYVVFVHGALDPWFDRQYPLKHFKKRLYWPIQYPILRDALAVIFTAELERDMAKSNYRPNKWNSMIIPLGIIDPEEDRPDSTAQIETFSRKFPALRGRRHLLFLARLHEKKGCDLLIEAFARVAASVPDVDLVVAGPDQSGMQAKLQALAEQLGIAGRVHWPGMIVGDLKWGALRSCDALLLPSHSENFGVAVVEALAVGRPVLISDKVNIWREIEGDHAGLIDDDSLEGTERMLLRWFNLPLADRDVMAAHARPCFLGRFEMSRTAAAINRAFARSVSEVE
jgi:glycosyltransferase involved in cell wall biosynthesis